MDYGRRYAAPPPPLGQANNAIHRFAGPRQRGTTGSGIVSNRMIMSPAFATTVAYDPTGNPYQMTYPAGATIYQAATAFPVAPEARPYELIPHRIFVGGFPATTTELDLRMFFEKFGHVREAKVIRSSEGTSKGYGFITFDTEEEAKAVMQISTNQDAEKLEFRGRRLNLGPAIRRTIHGPRYPQDYAIAAPAGQLFPASAFGGYACYPQSPVLMVPPNQMQPFVYSPVSTVAPAQYTFSTAELGSNRMQQQMPNNAGAQMLLMPNTGNTISPQDSPRTNGIGGQPQVMNSPLHIAATAVGQPQSQPQHQQQQQAYPITPSGMQQMAQVTQPLTPMTPSVTSQRAALFPPGAAYYAAAAPLSDMMHYSQMTAPTYFFAPNGYQTVDVNGQAAAAVALPAPNPLTQFVPQPLTQQQCCYEESISGGWQNPDGHQTSTPRRSPMKSVISLPNQLTQVNMQHVTLEKSYHRYANELGNFDVVLIDRKESQQGNSATATNKQFP